MRNQIKILLVDDSPTQRMELRSILDHEAYRIETADNGLNALDYLKNIPDLPDLILSDIFMPNMDGFELCTEVCKNYPSIPVIILTAYNDEKNLQKAFKSGAVDYIEKPFSKTEVLMRISNTLKLERRKNIEDKLLLSEKRFKDISLSLGDWIWEIDKEGKYIYCSEQIYDILGYHHDELIGKTPFDFMSSKEVEKNKNIFNDISRQGKPINDLKNWNIHKNGEKVCLLTNGIPILDKKRNIIGYRGVDKDVTKQVESEEKLKIAQERLSLALQSSNSGLWDWNIKTGKVVYDELWCEMLGYKMNDLKPYVSSWENLIHPDDKNKTLEELNRHFNNQKYEYTPEFRMKTKNADWKWIIARGKVVKRDQNGKPLRMIGIHNDIDVRKNLEKALEKSESQLQALLDNSPDMIVHIDINNKITWANKTVLDLFPNAIGKICIFTDSDVPCDGCPIRRTLKTGNLEKGLVTTHKTIISYGEQFWETVAVPLKDNTGKVIGILKISRNATDRIKFENTIKKANKELEKLAFTDTLTGLINRKPFIDLLEKNISKNRRIKQKLGLLFMDLDNFKSINDIYGHEIGDKVLKKASEEIRKCMRRSDFIGRFGGDEFILCLDGIKSPLGAVHVAQKINEAFSDKMVIEEERINTGASIGIAIYPDDAQDVAGLVKNGDLAMYKAKKQRKNSFHVYNTDLEKEFLFDQALRCALEKNEFKLSYQVIVDKDQIPYCAEALLRWENPKLGTIMPINFIPALDKDRSIVEVGEWVLREACNKLKTFNYNTQQQINVSINVSQFQMEDDLFISKIKNIIKETKVDPQNILIEITEKSQVKKIDELKNTLKQLKEIGIGFIALDDFGTGYSSFSNLIRYPIDIVKIDKFFIDRLKNEKYSDITSALVLLIKKYDLQVIAEGVETMEQFELLKNMGCDYFQGYYFSKPQKEIVLP
jgi:diguanylate cyclase (GGDEF)-like protein/PAS domain S-box-containing protein